MESKGSLFESLKPCDEGSFIRMPDTFTSRALVVIAAATIGFGQTRLDLRGQARNVDFGDAIATKPFVVGTTLPVTCSIGEAFFKSNATAGENLYLCTGTDTWVLNGAAAPYVGQFLTPTDPWTVSGSIHGLGTDVEVFVQEDGGTTWRRAYSGSVAIDKKTGDVSVDWSEPRAGRVLISQLKGGHAGGGSIGGGASGGAGGILGAPRRNASAWGS